MMTLRRRLEGSVPRQTGDLEAVTPHLSGPIWLYHLVLDRVSRCFLFNVIVAAKRNFRSQETGRVFSSTGDESGQGKAK